MYKLNTFVDLFPGVRGCRRLTSPTVTPCFLQQSNNIMTQSSDPAAVTAVSRHSLTFPLPHHHHHHLPHHHHYRLTDPRQSLPLITDTDRAERPVSQCWNQQGVSLTWSQFQTNPKCLFTQQPWSHNLH